MGDGGSFLKQKEQGGVGGAGEALSPGPTQSQAESVFSTPCPPSWSPGKEQRRDRAGTAKPAHLESEPSSATHSPCPLISVTPVSEVGRHFPKPGKGG